jgi:hypothetical protein
MRRSLRLIVLLLLMTAIPVRGAIGASLVLCGPGNNGNAPTAQVFTSAMHHGDRSPGTPHDHEHAAHGDVHDHGAAGPAHGHDGGSGDAVDPAQTTCSMCAACSAGGSGLLAAPFTVPVVDHVDDVFPPVLVHFERRPPDGLERPPHTSLV